MDWSKSKSIFIVVFLILDVLLYSLYLNRHAEKQQMEALGGLVENDIEARLKDDNITYRVLPNNIESASYISGKVKDFEEDKVDIQNAENISFEDKSKLIVTLKEPVKIPNLENEVAFNDFLKLNVYEGSSYRLWDIDYENNKATFYQQVNNRTIYNESGLVTIYWNEDNEVVMYEQTLLENIEAYDEEKKILKPIQAIYTLYAQGLINANSTITEMRLGYSTLVPLTQKQVFVPTWEVRVQTSENEEEKYFVNAVDGIEVKLDASKVEEVEDTIEEGITKESKLGNETDIEKK